MGNFAMTTTYEDTRLLLYDICHKFRRRYGGNFDDLMSEANLHFMAAYETYDPTKGSKFTTWARFRIWICMLETVRSKMRRAKNPNRPQQEYRDLNTLAAQAKFDIESFVSDLSEDASRVVGLVMDSPQDILYSIRSLGGHSPSNIKKALLEYLKDLGWSVSRIKESFLEIKQAL